MRNKALTLRVVASGIANSSTNSLKISVVNATSFIKLAFEKTTELLKSTVSDITGNLTYIGRKAALVSTICLTLFGTTNIFAQFGGGSGGVNDPFLIGTLPQWEHFATYVENGFSAGKFFKLTANIGSPSSPCTTMVGIKNSTIYNPFRGTLDGNKCTVNVNISVSSNDELNVGLFRVIDGATIKNLTITGSVLRDAINGAVGAFVGRINGGNNNFIKCINRADLIGGKWSAGISGFIENVTDKVIFDSCINRGNITSMEAAGISGEIESDATFIDCENRGKILGYLSPGDPIPVDFHVGGLITCCNSSANITLTNCHNYDSVSTNYIGASIGGIIGNVSGNSNVNFNGCTNNGNVTGGNRTGGFVGYITGSKSKAFFIYCTNNGIIKSTAPDGVAGGFIGQADGGSITFNDCENAGEVYGVTAAGFVGSAIGGVNVTTTGANKHTGIVDGESIGSALLGDIFNGAEEFYRISGHTNYGAVRGGDYAGAIFGKLVIGRRCTLYVENCTNYGPVSGGGFVGGIGGYINAVGGNATGVEVNISNLNNYGDVNRLSNSVGIGNVGGVIGEIEMAYQATAYISGCLNNGTISGYGNTLSGIIGSMLVYSESNKVTISNCKNAGTVEATGGVSYMAGILGTIGNKTLKGLSGCVNIGKILGMGMSSNTAGIVGYFNEGNNGCKITNCINAGIVSGGNASGIISFYYVLEAIENCINTNWIDGSGGSISGVYGTKPGLTPTDFINCYYDNQMSIVGAVAGSDIPGGAEGKSTFEMMCLIIPGYTPPNVFSFSPMPPVPGQGIYLYPRLGDDIINLLAAAPIFLNGNENVSYVNNFPFNAASFYNTQQTLLNIEGQPFRWGNFIKDRIKPEWVNWVLSYNPNSTRNALAVNPSTQQVNFSNTDNNWDTLSVRIIHNINYLPQTFNIVNDVMFEKAIPINVKPDLLKIIPKAGYGGKINPNKTVFLPFGFGGDTTFRFTPNSCYVVDSVFVDDALVGIGIDSFTFSGVYQDHTILVKFRYIMPDVFIRRWDADNDTMLPERTNTDMLVFRLQLKYPPLRPLVESQFVINENRGEVISVRQKEHTNLSDYYVFVMTDSSVGYNKELELVYITDIEPHICDNCLNNTPGPCTCAHGYALQPCGVEYYDVRKRFLAEPTILDPMQYSYQGHSAIIKFDEMIELRDTNNLHSGNVSMTAVAPTQDSIYVDIYGFPYISDILIFPFYKTQVMSNSTYEVRLRLPSYKLKDMWGNYNEYILYDFIGSFNTGMIKMVSNTDNLVSSSGGFVISDISPNPTNDVAEFKISVLEEGNLNVSIYDLSGSFVMDIISNRFMSSGSELLIPMHLGLLPSGTYNVMISMDNDNILKQVIVIK